MRAPGTLDGPVRFGRNFEKKVRKHIQQVRWRREPPEDIPEPGNGGTMSNSDPSSWTVPSWHPDYGDAKAELDHLRALALTLQAANCGLSTVLEVPEPGYMYISVFTGNHRLAEVYWRERGNDYAVFVFTSRGEVEGYPRTEAEAASLIISHLTHHSLPRR